ncbi:MAG: M61 family metallopeptidase, partial [Candidatus Xenobia bacterium]
TWRVKTEQARAVSVKYQVYADEMTVRTSFLNDRMGFFNGTNLFFFVRGQMDRPARVEIETPSGWQVYTGLAPSDGAFEASSYDVLADSPVQVGPHTATSFEVSGKRHRMVMCGEGNYDLNAIAHDVEAICRSAVAIFRDMPLEHYTFITHLPREGRGGLEHLNSTVLMFPRFGFRPRDKYVSFLALCAHEYFHLWNGKRIRPVGLGPFDYEREVHTRSLWVVEGWTSYYNDLLLRRAGLIDAKTLLGRFAKTWNGLSERPGRQVQSLAESSFDTWIKFYQPSPYSVNSTVSYYEKGAVVALMLDLEIRRRSGNQRSLDDVLRIMWQDYGRVDKPYPEDAPRRLAEEMADGSLEEFFSQFVYGTDELPLADMLAAFGIRVVPKAGSEGDLAPRWIGVKVRTEHGRVVISEVLEDSPAAQGGLSVGDEIVALDGHRVREVDIRERLAERKGDDVVSFAVFRDDLLRYVSVALRAVRPPLEVSFEADPVADEDACARYAAWLGEPHPAARVAAHP